MRTARPLNDHDRGRDDERRTDAGLPPARRRLAKLHALGFPSGSVRALLAVLIFATTWGLLVVSPTEEVPDYLRDLLFIIMGHYFASRGAAGPGATPGPARSSLPSGQIRVVLLVGFAAVGGTAVPARAAPELRKNPGVVTLMLVGGFLLGVVAERSAPGGPAGPPRPRISRTSGRSSLDGGRSRPGRHGLEPIQPLPVPPDWVNTGVACMGRLGTSARSISSAAVVGFYFGSRS